MLTKINFKYGCRNLLMALLLSSGFVSAQTLQEIEAHRVSLPNGWKLTPVGQMLPWETFRSISPYPLPENTWRLPIMARVTIGAAHQYP